QLFARRAEVWDAAGTPVTVVADLPVSDEVPRQGVPTGPRLVSWEERAPASLLWAGALDGGDPGTPAAHRDRIFRLGAPLTRAPPRAAPSGRARLHAAAAPRPPTPAPAAWAGTPGTSRTSC